MHLNMQDAYHPTDAETIIVGECQFCHHLQTNDGIKFIPGPDGQDPVQHSSTKKLLYLSFHDDRHDPDVSSESSATRMSAGGLCAFCMHLKPRVWNSIDLFFEVTLDPLSDIESRQSKCGLCSFFTKAITRAKQIDENSRTILRKEQPQSKRRNESKSFSLWLEDDEQIRKNICRFELEEEAVAHETFEAEPIVPELIDWTEIRAKLDAHPSPAPQLPHPSGFRVIDVKLYNVVPASEGCDYVALSYVWGKSPGNGTFQSSLANIHNLEQPGGLQVSQIPATIQDAMQACSRLGKRYLWVDRFCILQDEDNNPTKAIQINAMGHIYRQAYVTLVALDGDGAEHGLFGVSRLKREPVYIGKFPYAGLTEAGATLDLRDLLRQSVWNSRGWTFQEAMLSTRLLFFSHRGVVGACDSPYGTSFFFEKNLETRVITTGAPSLSPSDDRRDKFAEMVQQLMARSFTNENDILNASAGMLSLEFGDHRYGLPLEDFDGCMLWSRVTLMPGYDSESTERPRTPRDTFPSWSWCSIRGEMDLLRSRTISVSDWGFLTNMQGSMPRFVHPKPLNFDFTFTSRKCLCYHESMILAASISWQRGCMPEDIPGILASPREPWLVRDFVRAFAGKWKTYEMFWKDSHGVDWSGSPQRFAERFSPDQIQQAAISGRVLVYTQTVSLELMRMPKSSWGWGRFWIKNGNDVLGDVVMDTLERDGKVFEDGPGSGLPRIELLALSVIEMRSGIEIEGLENYDGVRNLSKSEASLIFEEGCGVVAETILLLKVLAIETNNEVSSRLGIGTVLLDKWLQLERSFKGIVLE